MGSQVYSLYPTLVRPPPGGGHALVSELLPPLRSVVKRAGMLVVKCGGMLVVKCGGIL